jgi:hypothetical protein
LREPNEVRAPAKAASAPGVAMNASPRFHVIAANCRRSFPPILVRNESTEKMGIFVVPVPCPANYLKTGKTASGAKAALFSACSVRFEALARRSELRFISGTAN